MEGLWVVQLHHLWLVTHPADFVVSPLHHYRVLQKLQGKQAQNVFSLMVLRRWHSAGILLRQTPSPLQNFIMFLPPPRTLWSCNGASCCTSHLAFPVQPWKFWLNGALLANLLLCSTSCRSRCCPPLAPARFIIQAVLIHFIMSFLPKLTSAIWNSPFT